MSNDLLTPLHQLARATARASQLAYAMNHYGMSHPEQLAEAVDQAEAAIERWRADQECAGEG